ncbi:MAG TPA: hypothetical protein PLV93_07855 [Microthrixaceae bacterium]|nr:hypothetical protein [Microthrixaceae bacterium]HNI35299.1 hypothetical protein [Microthrixaceae bacterium]
MTSLTVDLDDAAAERLQRQADAEGITLDELARRLLTHVAADDPFEFFGAGASDTLRGSNVDEHLEQHAFGRA